MVLVSVKELKEKGFSEIVPEKFWSKGVSENYLRCDGVWCFTENTIDDMGRISTLNPYTSRRKVLQFRDINKVDLKRQIKAK